MKLRISGNSVRYRLSKSEVAQICNEGLVAGEINFANGKLIYALEARENIVDLEANFNGNQITVLIPYKMINNWINNDTVGFENFINLSDEIQLKVLVEKDFKCLDNTEEDQSNNFDNPNEVC